jgi:GntR family transcriptional regulator, transcriptional repressor for pyruvate dehydrogenase complex
MAALRAMGLVDIRHGEGTFLIRSPEEVVASLSVEVLHSEADHPMVWEAREALEVHAARLAASRATLVDLGAMHDALSEMEAALARGEDGNDGDGQLHRAIVAAAHNPLLSQLYQSISEIVDRTSAASLSIPGRPPESLRAHRAIVEAIGDRDAERAASEMTSHLRGSARAFVAPAPGRIDES